MALWTSAFFASLAIHAAIAAALALAPASQRKQPGQTSITVQSAPRASAGRAAAAQKVAPLATAEGATVNAERTPLEASRTMTARITDVGQLREPVAAIPASAVAERAASTVRAAQPAGQMAVVAATEAVTPARPEPSPAPAQERRVVALEAIEPSAASRAVSAASTARVLEPAALPIAKSQQPIIVERSAPSGSVSQAGSIAQPVRATSPTAVARAAPQQIASAAAEAGSPAAAAPRANAVTPLRPWKPAEAAPAARQTVANIAPSVEPGAATIAESDQALVLLQPAPPDAPPPPETPQQSYAKLLDFLAGERDQCFLALASARDDQIEVNGYAAAIDRVSELGRSIRQLIETPAAIRGHLVSNAQCAALTFASNLASYPEQPLTLETAGSEIASGEELTGRIHNLRRKRLYLIIVDDDGKVQELQDLAVDAGDTVSFRAPFTLTDGPVGTVQLLLAIASDQALDTFSAHEGAQAELYFQHLRNEILSTGGSVDFGVASFVVR